MCSTTIPSSPLKLPVLTDCTFTVATEGAYACFVNNLEISDTVGFSSEGSWELQNFWHGATGLTLWLQLPRKGVSLETLFWCPERLLLLCEGLTFSFCILSRVHRCSLRGNVRGVYSPSNPTPSQGHSSGSPQSHPSQSTCPHSVLHAVVRSSVPLPLFLAVCFIRIYIRLLSRDYEILKASIACV